VSILHRPVVIASSQYCPAPNASAWLLCRSFPPSLPGFAARPCGLAACGVPCVPPPTTRQVASLAGRLAFHISPTKCCCALRLVIACWPTQPTTHPRALPPSLLLHFPSSFFRRAWCLPFLCGVGCAVRSSAYDPSGLRNTCTRHDSLIRISDWCTRFDHAVYPTHQIPLRLQMSIPIFLSLPPACCASARLLPFGFPALLGGCGWRLFPSCM
jgi:hypothetical protein